MNTTGPGHVPELSSHPSTLSCDDDATSISSDIAVRDNMVYSGGKIFTVFDQSRNGNLTSYLKSNEYCSLCRGVAVPSGTVRLLICTTSIVDEHAYDF